MASDCPDIRLVQNAIYPRYSVTLDWKVLGDGTLDDTEALATAVCVALGTDALASLDDRLPDPDSTDRLGWWGDYDADVIYNAWPIGCKLWLMRRAAIEGPNAQRGATMTLIKNYIVQAIQPFVDRGVASTFDATVTRVDKQRIDALIHIYRGPEQAIQLRYAILWDELQATSS